MSDMIANFALFRHRGILGCVDAIIRSHTDGMVTRWPPEVLRGNR